MVDALAFAWRAALGADGLLSAKGEETESLVKSWVMMMMMMMRVEDPGEMDVALYSSSTTDPLSF